MTAREKFPDNARIRMTERGSRQFPQTKPFGRVAGFSRKHPECVQVHVVGCTRAQRYHMDFWELDI